MNLQTWALIHIYNHSHHKRTTRSIISNRRHHRPSLIIVNHGWASSPNIHHLSASCSQAIIKKTLIFLFVNTIAQPFLILVVVSLPRKLIVFYISMYHPYVVIPCYILKLNTTFVEITRSAHITAIWISVVIDQHAHFIFALIVSRGGIRTYQDGFICKPTNTASHGLLLGVWHMNQDEIKASSEHNMFITKSIVQTAKSPPWIWHRLVADARQKKLIYKTNRKKIIMNYCGALAFTASNIWTLQNKGKKQDVAIGQIESLPHFVNGIIQIVWHWTH